MHCCFRQKYDIVSGVVCSKFLEKCISRQRQPHVLVEMVSGFAVSFTEGEILDSGDQRKMRLTDTAKYRQLYTV